MDRPTPAPRARYPVFQAVPTRWMDGDAFGHVNNAHYYSFIDTAICHVMVRHGVLTWRGGPHFMMAAESGCRFLGEVSFPDGLAVGVRVASLGRSSVRWAAGIFRDGADAPSAEGFMVHVCCDAATRRPAPLPDAWRTALRPLLEHPAPQHPTHHQEP